MSNPFDAGAESEPLPPSDVDVTPVELDVGPVIYRATDLFVSQPLLIIGAILIPVGVSLGFSGADFGVQMALAESSPEIAAVFSIVFSFVSGLANILLQLGLIRIFLGIVYGQPVNLSMLVGEGSKLMPAIAVTILMSLAVIFGLLFFIIPGVVLAVGLQFSLYTLVDKDLGPIEALQDSWDLIMGHKVTVFLVNLVIGFLGLVFSCMTFGFGYLLILPILSLVQAIMYQSLRQYEFERNN